MDDDSPPRRRRRVVAENKQNTNHNVSRSQKTKAKRFHISQFEEDDYLSQPSTSQRNATQSQLSQSSQLSQNGHDDLIINFDETEAVSRIVRYLLTADRTKHCIPRINIIKCALGGSSKNYRRILEKAESYLEEIFGYKLVEYESSKYILCNSINNSLLFNGYLPQEKSQLVLLFIILSHIFMNGGSSREESLWDFLKLLEIVTDDSFQHDYFGNVKYLVTTEFIKQLYLENIKKDEGDYVRHEYRWGPRANQEVSPRKVLELVTKYFGQRTIKAFESQYKALLRVENNLKSSTS